MPSVKKHNRAAIASPIHAQTTVPLDWISDRLQMVVRAGV